jgi:MSHA type pilus biogenesis protein MshL
MNVPLVRFFHLPGCGAGGRFLLTAALLAAWAALAEPARAKSETNEWTRVPRFETWPAPPPNSNAPARAIAAPAQPSQPAAPAAAKDKKLYSFRAENLELKAALALFARANDLNIVPDLDATGTITLDVRELPLEKMLQALLEANDLSWTEDDGLIRVRTTQSRNFVVDYLRLIRSGQGSSSVTLSSGGYSGGGNSSGGGGGGGGGGGAGGGGSGGGGGGNTSSQMALKLDNQVEFWKELSDQLERMLSLKGKESLAINRTAGIIQVVDRPSALRRVHEYLAQLNESVVRQVDIEAKLYDVTLGDQFQWGVDWQRIAYMQGGHAQALASPFGDPSQLNLTRSSFLSPGGGVGIKPSAITMLFSNKNTTAIIQALREQGEVAVISQPRLRTLNNQTAIMKVGTDQPFFIQQNSVISSAGGITQQSGDNLSMITVGTVLSVTPQISSDGWVTLDITPAITSFVEERQSPSHQSSAPVLDIKQTSALVRLRDGETVVMGGLIQKSTAKSVRKIPLLGDIPFLGKLFQGRVDAKQKKELVIFLTPTIIE